MDDSEDDDEEGMSVEAGVDEVSVEGDVTKEDSGEDIGAVEDVADVDPVMSEVVGVRAEASLGSDHITSPAFIFSSLYHLPTIWKNPE